MDEKFHYYNVYARPSSISQPSPRPFRAPRSRRLRTIFLASCLIAILFFSQLSLRHVHPSLPFLSSPPSPPTQFPLSPANKTGKVPLEAHIMSKCPDAKDCLREMIVPAMEKVADKVDFRLSYIGTVDPSSDSVSCKHGPDECLGNMLSLCTQTLYPNSTLISLGFSTCMISSYRDIPSRPLIQNCALEHGVDFEKLNDCVSSEEGKGVDLLRESVERSREKGVKYSCTVRLDEEIRCVRDGGKWKQCEGGSGVGDLVRDVERLYAQL